MRYKNLNLFEDIKEMNLFYGFLNNNEIVRVYNNERNLMAMNWSQSLEVTIDSHFHDWLEITLILEGRQIITVDNQQYILTSGDFLIIDYNKVHSVYCEVPTHKVTMQFKMGFIERLIPEFDSSKIYCNSTSVTTPYERYTYEGIINLFSYMAASFIRTAPEIKPDFLGYFYLFFDCIMKECEMSTEDKVKIINNTHINQILSYINKHYHEDISLTTLSNVIHLTPQYISKMIKNETGKNFKDYLINLRIEYAQELIKSTDKSLITISEECGFPNNKSFIFHFKAKNGVLPSEYRKKNICR